VNAWVNRWLGAEIVFVQVGHGLIGAALLGVLAANVPWWSLLLIAPLILFSLWFWLYESSFVMPLAREMLAGRAAGRMTATATTRPRGFLAARRDGPSTHQ
jgi:hypothetical protein